MCLQLFAAKGVVVQRLIYVKPCRSSVISNILSCIYTLTVLMRIQVLISVQVYNIMCPGMVALSNTIKMRER